MRIEFTILGKVASKANSRQLVPRKMRGEDGKMRTRMVNIKSDSALEFEAAALKQIPPKARVRLDGPCRIALKIWYPDERSDLDESLVLDCLQDRYATKKIGRIEKRVLLQHGVVKNDRQFRQRVCTHGIDRANPRVWICIEPLQAQQIVLALEDTLDPFALLA